MNEKFNRTIFLIDGDLEEHILFKDALLIADKSSTLLTSFDCGAAMKLLRVSSLVPDIIFMDLNLPGITGFDCLCELKKIENLKNTPIIIYTTSSRPEDKKLSGRLGASYFITKPNGFETLCSVLEVMFEKFIDGIQVKG